MDGKQGHPGCPDKCTASIKDRDIFSFFEFCAHCTSTILFRRYQHDSAKEKRKCPPLVTALNIALLYCSDAIMR